MFQNNSLGTRMHAPFINSDQARAERVKCINFSLHHYSQNDPENEFFTNILSFHFANFMGKTSMGVKCLFLDAKVHV